MTPQEYRDLLADFLTEALPVDVFETMFLKAWRSTPGLMPEGLFPILTRLFYAVEEYSPFYQPGDEKRHVNSEAHLRTEGVAVLQQLDEYLRMHRLR